MIVGDQNAQAAGLGEDCILRRDDFRRRDGGGFGRAQGQAQDEGGPAARLVCRCGEVPVGAYSQQNVTKALLAARSEAAQ